MTCIQAARASRRRRDARQFADLTLRHLRAGAVDRWSWSAGSRHRQDGPAGRRRRQSRLDSPEQRPDPQGTRRDAAGASGRHAVRDPPGSTRRPGRTGATANLLPHRAVTLLADGESVIADASWISAPEHRRRRRYGPPGWLRCS